MTYCGERHAEGWFCVLRKGHQDGHLSLDNSKLWKGTPGFPVVWEAEELPREGTDELDPTLTQAEYKQTVRMNKPVQQTPHFTGRACPECGSLNTIQNGKCLLCMECKATGECG